MAKQQIKMKNTGVKVTKLQPDRAEPVIIHSEPFFWRTSAYKMHPPILSFRYKNDIFIFRKNVSSNNYLPVICYNGCTDANEYSQHTYRGVQCYEEPMKVRTNVFFHFLDLFDRRLTYFNGTKLN